MLVMLIVKKFRKHDFQVFASLLKLDANEVVYVFAPKKYTIKRSLFMHMHIVHA